MGLADRVTAHVDARRADPVTLEEFGYLVGRDGAGTTKAGVAVGAKRALGIPAWWSGCRYIAEQASFLPVATFRGRQTERVRRADASWLTQPDTETPWSALVEHWVMSLLHRGNAYAFKLRNPVGQVTGLRPVHPDRVRVGLASDGTKVFQVDNRVDVGFTRREMLHIPGLSYDGCMGIDVIRAQAETLGSIAAAEEFAHRSFGQGSHLQAYISLPQPLTQPQADELKAQWERFHKGVQNAHEFGVLGNGAEYKTISLNPEQVQLLQTRQWGVVEVAQILRIPPHKLYDLSRATFSNIEHQSIEAVTDSIRPWIQRIETWVNFDLDLLPTRNFIEFNLEGLLRGDAGARAAFYNAGINGGWLTPQTAAQKENLPAPDELDYYQRPLNVSVIRPGEGTVPDKPDAA
jgi:HK97 family phage portal protein